jgi:hypothetical protein
METRALDLIARVSSRLVHEILPVATASVIGAMLVNHYGRQPPLPSIVVQAQPSASENAIAQSLREDRELLASFAKRREEFVKRRQESGRGPRQRRLRCLSQTLRRSRKSRHRFQTHCHPQLRSSLSRARGRSSASPAPCANGSRTWLRHPGG